MMGGRATVRRGNSGAMRAAPITQTYNYAETKHQWWSAVLTEKNDARAHDNELSR